ncbi:MAG: hypothetical protein U0228_11380 [Myxococcaceae bacterium]
MDEERELERIERDLAAIDLRRMRPGYTTSLPLKVMEEEREHYADLESRRDALVAKLAQRSAPAESGTLSSTYAGTWGALPMGQAESSATPAFGVTATLRKEPRDLVALGQELQFLLALDWQGDDFARVRTRLADLGESWRGEAAGEQLIAAADRHVGLRALARGLDHGGDPQPTAIHDVAPRLLLDGAEPVDVLTGLNAFQREVLNALVVVAPPSGRFARVSDVVAEMHGRGVVAESRAVERALIVMGHPLVRAFPLVELHGLNRLEPHEPTITHARCRYLGVEVSRREPPLPMLLVNGAAASGRWIPPVSASGVLRLCIRLVSRVIGGGPLRVEPFECIGELTPDVASRSYAPTRHHIWTPHPDQARRLRGTVIYDVSSADPRVVAHPPWPLTFDEARRRLEPHLSHPWLIGVARVVDLSGAEGVRVGVELRHPVFARQTAMALMQLQPFGIAIPAMFHPQGFRGHVHESVIEFLQLRFAIAKARLEAGATEAGRRAEEEEAVRVALVMLPKVQELIRSADDDASAIEALQSCFTDADRAALATLEFPVSHSYERGFTRKQAAYLVKQRKLQTRTVEMARADWARALERARESKPASDVDVWEVVLVELSEQRRRLIEGTA